MKLIKEKNKKTKTVDEEIQRTFEIGRKLSLVLTTTSVWTFAFSATSIAKAVLAGKGEPIVQGAFLTIMAAWVGATLLFERKERNSRRQYARDSAVIRRI